MTTKTAAIDMVAVFCCADSATQIHIRIADFYDADTQTNFKSDIVILSALYSCPCAKASAVLPRLPTHWQQRQQL